LTPSFKGKPRTQVHEILSRKTIDLEAAPYRRWLRRAKHSAVARKNTTTNTAQAF